MSDSRDSSGNLGRPGKSAAPRLFQLFYQYAWLFPKPADLTPDLLWTNLLYRIFVIGMMLGVLAAPTLAVWAANVNFYGVIDTDVALGALLGLVPGLVLDSICYLMLRVARRAIGNSEPALHVVPAYGAEEMQFELKQAEDAAFSRNRTDVFVLRSLELNGVRFFGDFVYPFAPRVNVLLGKNGFGKTLLLRALAAMIQRDAAVSRQIVANSDVAVLRLTVTRNGITEETVRIRGGFQTSTGGIPLLAIPDSRFVNRSQPAAGVAAVENPDLWRSGAQQFLSQQPYENVIQDFLYELGLDFVTSKVQKCEDFPVLALLQSVVRKLTDNDEFAFSRIERYGRTGFQFWVTTAGTQGDALQLQYASQGTLSVLAIFGLIYSFLRSLRPSAGHNEIVSSRGIIFIDEIDAHLHPSWQQRILAILTDTFPNVQFIISAHSPLIVAGCDRGEVAVLRRKENRMSVEILDRDFMGASSRELYDLVFEIDDTDRLYWQYSLEATTGRDKEVALEINRLESKPTRTTDEEERLQQLYQKRRLIQRATEVRREKLEQVENETRVESLKEEVTRLRSELDRLKDEAASA